VAIRLEPEGAMDAPNSFGYWVRRRRKALDLTQDALARQVGCAKVTIQKIEADERRPSRQIAERLADCLAISSEERDVFLQIARAELGADRLTDPTQQTDRMLAERPGRAPAAPTRADSAIDTSRSLAPAPLPSGTVTFLFTDIEESTQRWEQHPQAMHGALARHDTLLRTIIEGHAGVVFKTTGDGIHAAFARATDALRAALAAQRAITTEDWGAVGAMRVRMALHTGVTEERDGDYFGPPLNRVARLLAAGHGGQVLLSRSAQELVRDHLPHEVELRDLGEHRLKDLSYPEQIFQLVAPDLPADFPPLRTLDVQRTNLPAQPTPLIGREREVAMVRGLLRRVGTRLVTLTGPGGVGKTRLGLQTAAELLDEYQDGVFFVNLAPITDPAFVDATIAQALRVRAADGQPLLDSLKAYLRAKHMLLLLDNFEQVVETAPVVADLLAAAPDLTVLVTSRAVLHLSGEHEFAVPPLALPDPMHLPPHERLTQYEAIALFIARAQAVNADFALTELNAPAIADICHRLDGLPLAIELAAARVKLLAPAAILARLGSRLTLLTGGPRDLPARQQTLRNTIEWSYQLLDASEQALFAQLAVFVGGCTLEAAEAVCNAAGELPRDTLDGLAALIDQSLLRQEEGPAPRGYPAPRFVMLETIREYAVERLELSGDAAAVRRRHAAYYLTLAEQAEPALLGAEQGAWMERLDAEIDNLRTALAWLRSTESAAEAGLQLAGALGEFWVRRGYLNEGRAWLADMLSRPAGPTTARAYALCKAGFLAWYQSDLAQAAALLTESLALYRKLGDKIGIGWALRELGLVAANQEDFSRAAALYEESLALFRERGYASGSACVLATMGIMAVNQRDMERAASLLSEALALFRELGDWQGIVMTLGWLGYVTINRDDLERAMAMLEESLALCREQGLKSDGAWVLVSLGIVADKQRQPERAAELYAEGLAVFRELNVKRGTSMALGNLGYLALDQGDYERAAALLAESLAVCREIGDRWVIPRLLRSLGTAALAQGDDPRAAAAFAEGLTLSQSLEDKHCIAASLEQLARIASRAGQPERAARLFGVGEIMREVSGIPLDTQIRSDYDRAVAAVRAQLDDATFAAAWAAGRAMSLEAAIAAALGEAG
jgi:predicted ATPase/class 3 adenylate cyclase